MRQFKITDEEEVRINEWLLELKERIVNENPLDDPLGLEEPYYGAIGGGITYSFTQTSLGVILVVKETITGETLNLTDYESW